MKSVLEYSKFYSKINPGLCFDLNDPSGRGVLELKKRNFNFEIISTRIDAALGDEEYPPREAFDQISIFGESDSKVMEMKNVLKKLGFTCYPDSIEHAIWSSMGNRYDGRIIEEFIPTL